MSEHFEDEREHARVKDEVDQMVRRSLIELADLQGLSERIHSIGERLSELTPAAKKSATKSDDSIRPHHDCRST